MKNMQIIIITFITVITIAFWFIQTNKRVVESITYFPADPNATYIDAKTTITDPTTMGEKEYQFKLKTYSKLDRPAYLRQDITLFYADGRLIGKLGKWEEKKDQIENESLFTGKNNHLFSAITFHHSELHNDGEIFSAQLMSKDSMYIVHSPITNLTSFNKPNTEDEFAWKEFLDQKENQLLVESLEKAINKFSITPENYQVIPLTDLVQFNDKPIPGFSKEESKAIIGRLWEGIYKNYFLGIRKSDGTLISPLNSTIPHIFISKNKDHLYVLFETADGESIFLYQTISNK